MYAVEVREHVMLAHSLPGETFGPAQNLHGATYVVDVALFRRELDGDSIVVDIGRLHETLKEVLSPLNYANLDVRPEFAGVKTTTEFLCKWIFDQMAAAVKDGRLGPSAAGVERMKITLNESHVARAWYEGDLA